MKILIMFILFVSLPNFAQNFLNISYFGETQPPDNINFNSLNKITFSGEDIIFFFTDNSTTINSFSEIEKITYNESGLELFFNPGSSPPDNSTNLSMISKITLGSSQITFLLSDNSTVIKNFSEIEKMFYSGSDGENPLPVEIINLGCVLNGKDVELHWSTATEMNNYGFEIERCSMDLDNSSETSWDKIGFTQGHGNSNKIIKYSYIDTPNGGTAYRYRLKQIDTDGGYLYSSTVDVKIGVPSRFELRQNYPNPFNPSTKIEYDLPVNGIVELTVYNILGRKITTLVNEEKNAGSYSIIFNGKDFASGAYFCEMKAGNFYDCIKMLIVK